MIREGEARANGRGGRRQCLRYDSNPFGRRGISEGAVGRGERESAAQRQMKISGVIRCDAPATSKRFQVDVLMQTLRLEASRINAIRTDGTRAMNRG
jgi:hypothetical protein